MLIDHNKCIIMNHQIRVDRISAILFSDLTASQSNYLHFNWALNLDNMSFLKDDDQFFVNIFWSHSQFKWNLSLKGIGFTTSLSNNIYSNYK